MLPSGIREYFTVNRTRHVKGVWIDVDSVKSFSHEILIGFFVNCANSLPSFWLINWELLQVFSILFRLLIFIMKASNDVCNLRLTSSSTPHSKPLLASDVDWFVNRIHAHPVMNLSNFHKQTSRYSSTIINGLRWKLSGKCRTKEGNKCNFLHSNRSIKARVSVVVILVPGFCYVAALWALAWKRMGNDCQEFTTTMFFLSFSILDWAIVDCHFYFDGEPFSNSFNFPSSLSIVETHHERTCVHRGVCTSHSVNIN